MVVISAPHNCCQIRWPHALLPDHYYDNLPKIGGIVGTLGTMMIMWHCTQVYKVANDYKDKI